MPSYVQGNSVNTAGVSVSLAYPGAVSSGDTLVCAVRVGTLSSSPVIGDDVNGASSWTVLTQVEVLGNDTLYVGYFQNSAAGTPTVTASWTGSGSIRYLIMDYTDVAAASVDQVATNESNGVTTFSTPSVTTSTASEILIAIVETSSGFTVTSNLAGSNPSSGWTRRWSVDIGKLIADDVTVSSIGTYQEVLSILGGGDSMATAILTLQAPAPPAVSTAVAGIYVETEW